ncbi:uncharacterized protein PAC_11233 [Phialocephala subalpina]|uniref:Uncharacterized protein n=1 Tax=Phialocephala subalpina TaxID=576137 RepID=A0A1L7X8M5_9HELO|nr:uncharacterized protein PAC_11233 [Phialocephala subalpina]
MSNFPRWPRNNTGFNNADNVERYLQEGGHRTWGLVIYRCTYDSDDDWNKFIDLFQHHTKQALEAYNGLGMMDSMSLTIVEDRPTLDDARTSFVREHFKHWAAAAAEMEQGEGVEPGLSQRYRYCIQVDDAALESMFDYGSRKYSNLGHVNLIQKDWEPYAHVPKEKEPVENPIEDCTLHDVGWMMISYTSVMVDEYCQLQEDGNWYTEYQRPPKVIRG